MSGYRTFEEMRPVPKSGRPQTPVVPLERCRPSKPEKPAPEPAPAKGDSLIGVRDAIKPLLRAVMAETGLSRYDITGHNGVANRVRARQALCWLAVRFTPLSLPQIAEQIGGRDHTTVLHSVRVVDRVVAAQSARPGEDTVKAWAAFLCGISASRWNSARSAKSKPDRPNLKLLDPERLADIPDEIRSSIGSVPESVERALSSLVIGEGRG